MAGETNFQPIQVTSENEASKTSNKLLAYIDNWQLSSGHISFIYAVIKKYSQDQAGNLAALITYYGFLSLFPLLIALLSITQLAFFKSAHLKHAVTKAMLTYFPLIGHQLENYAHVQQKAGIALAISILVIIYGARGIANMMQLAMNNIWLVPIAKRAHGAKQAFKSFGIIIAAGIGFLLTGFLSTYGMLSSSNIVFRIISFVFSIALTFFLVLSVFWLSVANGVGYKELIRGSIIAAIGFQIIQTLGGFLIAHELSHFNTLYGSFAIVFVLLFWLYLQARILLYASEVDSIFHFKLWPRSITGFRLTPADQIALKLYAQKENYLDRPKEKINVEIDAQKTDT